MHASHATITTTSASRYLQQLCKHWQHNLTVDFTPEAGTVIFPLPIEGTTLITASGAAP